MPYSLTIGAIKNVEKILSVCYICVYNFNYEYKKKRKIQFPSLRPGLLVAVEEILLRIYSYLLVVTR